MSGPAAPTRRALLAAAAMLAGGGRGRAAEVPRVAALDWGWASTLVAVGVDPVGVAERRGYADWVGEPALPASTAELGLRTTPGLETLAALRPDLILTNDLNASLRTRLERIAPTLDCPVFTDARTPLRNAAAAARLLGARLGRPESAERFVADSDRRFAAAAARLAGLRGWPLVPLQMRDRHHVVYYGRGSLYGDVLERIGLRNAYPGPTSRWGHRSDDLASLAGLPPADLLIVDPLPPGAAPLLAGRCLLASLVAAGGRSLHRLPAAWVFGDLSAAARFAELVADALAPRATGMADPFRPAVVA